MVKAALSYREGLQAFSQTVQIVEHPSPRLRKCRGSGLNQDKYSSI